MTTTHPADIADLDDLELPVVEGHVDWDALSIEELHRVVQGVVHRIDSLEPNEPTEGVLERSLQHEATVRAMSPLQHRYAGLLEDAFETPKLRGTVGLPKGKTAFRDANDLLAKTHGLRAYEASGRLKIAATLTPARASDPNRDDALAVGETKYPSLGALQAQGTVHHSKLSTALTMLNALDDHAQLAGKDQAFRDQLRTVVEKDLAGKIEHTTPEEFSRYVSRRKTDLIAAMDPPDQQFTPAQTEAMHTMVCHGTVRGNANAYKWTVITDAEGNEVLNGIVALANNPRAKAADTDETGQTETTAPENADTTKPQDDDPDQDTIVDRRTRGQRAMHALRDALKYVIANVHRTDLPGANGNHTQLVVLADYPTLMQHLRDQLGDLLPEIDATRREMLLQVLAETHLNEAGGPDPSAKPERQPAESFGTDRVLSLPTSATVTFNESKGHSPPITGPPKNSPAPGREDGSLIEFPPPKTTNLAAILDDENLDQLQPRIAQGIYTPYYPPEIILRLLCDVSVSPVTLTGDREVLSIGRKRHQFPKAIRRAILARDRGCTVPGCHWPAAWCELHHVKFWSNNGVTSTDNGVTLCAHHHQALHAKALSIKRVNGELKFIQHPLIDPTQQPRENYFWQN